MENINTISVLIVDDEYLIRSLIRNSVRWEAYGMEVVGEAGDGESALSFIRTFQPQIALVDINSPSCCKKPWKCSPVIPPKCCRSA